MRFENVQVGDKLIVGGGFLSEKRVETVEKITKTQITTDRGRYSKQYGRLIGSVSVYTAYIHIPQEGEIEAVTAANHHRQLADKLDGVKWRGISAEKMQRILDILEETE